MKTTKSERVAKSAILNRLLLLLLLGAVWFIGILVRLVYLQGFKAEDYRANLIEQQTGFEEIRPKRGDIFDRNLEKLVLSVRADFVYAHPPQVNDPRKTADSLARTLQLESDEVLDKLTSGKGFVYLKRKVPPHESREVRNLGLKGISTREEGRRIYPNRELASHVVGFVGLDDEGLGGLEYSYNKELGGKPTRVTKRFDAKRNSYQRITQPDQTRGNNLILTLDRSIQHIAEQVLRKTVNEHQAINGVAIVMEPNTGEVLAMASYPTFDPNNYTDSPVAARRNRAILDLYEPGSTFKTITLAAVLNERLARLNEVIDCRIGAARLAGKVYKEAKTTFEDLTVEEIFAKSSNVGTVQLGMRLGNGRLYDYIELFGFGEKTNIELPGEESGLVRPVSQWSKISIGAISIGQEIAVTPIQMIRAVAATANGGYLVEPHILQQILTPEGDVVSRPRRVKKQILKPSTCALLRRAMKTVVLEGTGRGAQLDGYSAAGKTGTAQKIVDGRYSKDKYVASFVGYAPAEDPSLITLVVINEPRGIPWGGYVAGPAFKEIMERSLIQLKVPRDQSLPLGDPQTTLAQSGRPAGELTPKQDISVNEERLLMNNLEETVMSLRSEESDSPDANTFTFLLEPRVLPDFKGKNLREVARECADLGLRLKISGTGIAVGQRPAPGKRVSKNTLCEVFFSPEGQRLNAAPKVALKHPNRMESEN